MKPSRNASTVAAITRAKGKMYEYKVEIEDHLSIPDGLVIEELFPFAIGTLGDYAAEISRNHLFNQNENTTSLEEVKFSATVLQAYVDSRINNDLSFDLLLMASCAYYLCDMPGNSILMFRRSSKSVKTIEDDFYKTLAWLLNNPWDYNPPVVKNEFTQLILHELISYYRDGQLNQDSIEQIAKARAEVYSYGTANELLLTDLSVAIFFYRLLRSTRNLLPQYSGLPIELWKQYLDDSNSLKELWPSQRVMGESSIFSGASAVIQMPTSAGKTKASELILRTAFLSGRTKFAIVIAPFRALCEEISSSLALAFSNENLKVNQLTDALQPDYMHELAELLGTEDVANPHVIIITPEKLLYLLRQKPNLIEKIGLIIYDEGHQFDTGPRGVTYELLLTSIKRLLVDEAQTLLISAVIQNAGVLAEWLLNDSTKIIIDTATQTQRAIAYTSWIDTSGQLSFHDHVGVGEAFFVPRIITAAPLQLRKNETKARNFPDKTSNSIALYLGLRIVSNGGVAIFCGLKSSVSTILRHLVDIFSRGTSSDIPAEYCDKDELSKLSTLYALNFGAESYLTKSVELGVFPHHGDTPHGLRLAVEHSMREGLIRFVVCTSTLAQGVNLPIRYLIVTGIMQGGASITVRDFHNLMGRAGRAGIHGEGTVIFSDPIIHDNRRSGDNWRWNNIQSLLRPELTEPTGSSLVKLISQLTSESNNNYFDISPIEVLRNLLYDRDTFFKLFQNLPPNFQGLGFTEDSLQFQLETKCHIIDAVESFLMSYRQDDTIEDFIETSKELAKETFAYALSDDANKLLFVDAFALIASHIEEKVVTVEEQKRYGRSLLGVNLNLEIDEWVGNNIVDISLCTDELQLLVILWPLLERFSESKRMTDVTPSDAVKNIAFKWMEGNSYEFLFKYLSEAKATYPRGQQRRAFNIDALVSLCEQGFGYGLTLLLTAVTLALEKHLAELPQDLERYQKLMDLLQKKLKYGLPTQESIAFYEVGFGERVVAQYLANVSEFRPKSISEARNLLIQSKDVFKPIIEKLPSFFKAVYIKTIS